MNEVKLGQIIDGEAFRDAVHVAVEPIVAPVDLHPGQRVDQSGNPNGKHVGIVDPFLTHQVIRGERCWLCLFPGTITSLRHGWTHPAFVADPVAARDPEGESMRFIENIARQCATSAEYLLDAADRWVEAGDYTCMGENESYKDVDYSKWPEFWKHYEKIRGVTVVDHESTFFSCSC